MSAPPPPLAAWLAARATPPADREALIGDLEEEYRRILDDEGVRAARLFYWSEAFGALVPGLRRRLAGFLEGEPLPHAPLPRGGSMLDAIRLDLKLAARALARQPRLVAMVVLTLAVGMAANTAVFAVIDGVVLRPFPFPEPERLVTVGTAIPKTRQELTFFENLSPAEYLDIARECRTLEGVVAWDMGNRQVAHSGGGENLFSAFFWGDAFPTLGMAPAVGRGFTADELRQGEKVAIVSHRYWSTRLNRDPGVVGGRLLVNGEPYTVVGVMPPGALVYGTDLWLPMLVGPEVFPRQRRQFQVLARVAPGRTLDDVNAELAGLVQRLAATHGAEVPEYEGMRLVGLEVAGAAVLLVSCGLLLRSLDRLGRVDPGLAASEIVGFRVTLPYERYDGPRIAGFFRELEERAAAVPGVASATVAAQYPPIGFSRLRFRVTGAEPRREEELLSALFTSVTPRYLATTGVRLREGRFLSDDDVAGRPPVAVVNETAARRYFGGAAVGRSFEFGSGEDAVRLEVVGVVSDAHNRGLDRPADPELFVNVFQDPSPANQYFVMVRARVDPLSLVAGLRAQVAAMDPEQPIYAVQTVRQALDAQGLPRRVASSLLLVLTVVALVLAGTGVFAIVSHVTASRTREIAVRMALGATGAAVRGLVVRQALVPAVLGGAVGLAGAVALTQAASGLLFDVRPFDPLTLAVAAALLAALAVAASDGPARRAARLDPVTALRAE